MGVRFSFPTEIVDVLKAVLEGFIALDSCGTKESILLCFLEQTAFLFHH
jgi:hypothetical protein